jgi:hypothetical protein
MPAPHATAKRTNARKSLKSPMPQLRRDRNV